MRLLLSICIALSLFHSRPAAANVSQFEIGHGTLQNPVRIACGNGLVYVCDTGLKAVLAFDRSGMTVCKTAPGQLESPTGIAISDFGRIYVCDSTARKVHVFDKTLSKSEILALPDNISLVEPYDITIDCRSTVNILDRSARTVHLVGLGGRYLGQYCAPGISQNQLAWPQSIASIGKDVAISDAGVGKIIIINSGYREARRFGMTGNWPSSVRFPSDLHTDKAGNFYIVDQGLSDVSIYPSLGTAPLNWGRFGNRENPTDFFKSDLAQNQSAKNARGYMRHPSSIATDDEYVYVADTGNRRILVESLDAVLEQPRVSPLPFVPYQPDFPAIVASPQSIDFGSVATNREYVRKVSIKLFSTPCTFGRARVSGNYFDVEPKLFVGSTITLYIRHKTNSPGTNNAIVTIELPDAKLDISVTALCNGGTGLRFRDQPNGPMSVSGDPVSANFELEAGNGFAESVRLSIGRIAFKTPWAKVARGSDDLVLSTLGLELSAETIGAGSPKTFAVKATPLGVLRPGVYFARITAESESGKHKATHDLTIIIASNISEPQSTVLLETFTAHWCEPCGFQREAGYRLMSEYGPRAIIPIAYHVMDDADLEITGLTRPEHFDLFKGYGGEGVPLNAYDGDVSKNVASGKQLAHDRIRGRKYSGTTLEYWKMRGDFDQAFKRSKIPMNVWAKIDGSKGIVSVEAVGHDFQKSTENELMVVLTEDDMEYSSSNGEQYHHLVVRLVASKHQTSFVANGSHAVMGFDIPKMPEGYGINFEKARIVAFFSGWFDIASGTDTPPLVFLDSKAPTIAPNSSTPLRFYMSNPSMKLEKFTISITSNPPLKIAVQTPEVELGSAMSLSAFANIDTSEIQDLPASVELAIELTSTEGKKYSFYQVLPTSPRR